MSFSQNVPQPVYFSYLHFVSISGKDQVCEDGLFQRSEQMWVKGQHPAHSTRRHEKGQPHSIQQTRIQTSQTPGIVLNDSTAIKCY